MYLMAIPFTIDFTAPGATGNLTLAAITRTLDPTGYPNAIRLTWLPVTTAPENIDRIEIWMSDSQDTRRIARFTNPAVTTYVYHFPRSGDNTEYYIIQFLKSGTNVLTGLWGIASMTLSFPFIHLASVKSPATLRLPIQYWTNQQETLTQTQDWQLPAGGTEYIEVSGSLRGTEFAVTGQLIDAQDASGITAEQLAAMFRAMFKTRDIFCYRNPRGHKLFIRPLGNPTLPHLPGTIRYTLSFNVRTVAYTEGVI
jgi:hypothetical protein